MLSNELKKSLIECLKELRLLEKLGLAVREELEK